MEEGWEDLETNEIEKILPKEFHVWKEIFGNRFGKGTTTDA